METYFFNEKKIYLIQSPPPFPRVVISILGMPTEGPTALYDSNYSFIYLDICTVHYHRLDGGILGYKLRELEQWWRSLMRTHN